MPRICSYVRILVPQHSNFSGISTPPNEGPWAPSHLSVPKAMVAGLPYTGEDEIHYSNMMHCLPCHTRPTYTRHNYALTLTLTIRACHSSSKKLLQTDEFPVTSAHPVTTLPMPWASEKASSMWWNMNGWLQILRSCMIVFIRIFAPPRP